MMKWLNYHHLIYFKTIAVEGSISKASKILSVGQPALSAQLKSLEEYFGHKLFERKNRSLVLTEAGRIALDYAIEINEKGQELLNIMGSQSFSKQYFINIGALDSVPKTLITKLIEFARKNFDCKVKVLEGRGDELFREILNHQLDILISNYPASHIESSKVYSRPLSKTQVSFYGSRKYKKLIKDYPESLNDQVIILPTSHSKLRQDIDHYLNSHKITFKNRAEIQDTSIQKLLAIDGEGLIAIPDFSAEDYIKNKSLYKIGTLEGVYESFWLTSAERSIENPVAAKILSDFISVL